MKNTYESSNCCDAYVYPDYMICSDCKEPCDIIIDNEEIYTIPKKKDYTLLIAVLLILTPLIALEVYNTIHAEQFIQLRQENK